MKKILLIIVLCLGLLVSVVLIRTIQFSSRQINVEPITDIEIDEKEVAEHLSNAIRFKTISYKDTAKFDSKEFLGLHKYFEKIFPNIHRKLTKEIIGNYSILFTWKGSESNLKPIILMAHIDVVPVEPNTEKNWKYPPFKGSIANGYIWGRGTMDDKASVLGILEAVEILLKKGFKPRRTIYLAFGSDEEIGGRDGAARIVKILQSRGVEPEYVLDEGLAIVKKVLPYFTKPVALIGIAEKGYLSVDLIVKSKGGHSSTPPEHTAIGMLSTAIHKLENQQMPAKIEGPVKQMFEYIGPELPFNMKIIFANLWLFSPLVIKNLSALPPANALIRTTTALTIFNAGIKDNVLPSEARAVVNFRIHPSNNIGSVIKHIRETINDSQVKIKHLHDVQNPSAISSIDSLGFKIINKTIRQVFLETIVAPSLVIAATDSRHYQKLTKNIYRFVPLQVSKDDLNRIHGTNERIALQNYKQIIKFYIQLIRNSN